MVETIIRKCPQFVKCSVNACPLSSDYPVLCKDPEERKCKLSKVKRMELAKGSSLRYGGMTRGDYQAQKKWDNLPEQERKLSQYFPFWRIINIFPILIYQ